MATILTENDYRRIEPQIEQTEERFKDFYRGDTGQRQPVHTVYGGAHLFKADSAARLGRLAMNLLDTYGAGSESFVSLFDISPALADKVYSRVVEKLRREPVEDFRIDFEDGFGVRSDSEEDSEAVRAALEVARGIQKSTLPPFLGIRIKPLDGRHWRRALRTLDVFLTALLESSDGRLPENFLITLPKVSDPETVSHLVRVLEALEKRLGLEEGSLRIELMIELPQALVGATGSIVLPDLVKAARGRCRGAHFGTYDYTAARGITAEHQTMGHPACDFAREMMQVALAGTGLQLSDGATNILPVPAYPATDTLSEAQLTENREVVQRAWRLHYRDTRHSLRMGYYQGWDLHPGQFPSRYAAVYSFFLESFDRAVERFRTFLEQSERATLSGDVFDDAATALGLRNFFRRALRCGAITEQEVEQAGLGRQALGDMQVGIGG